MLDPRVSADHVRRQDGWSMIEVVIAIIVIALVAAYAIPKLLGPRSIAGDGAAKTALRAAQTAGEVYWAQEQTYLGFADRFSELESSVRLRPEGPDGPDDAGHTPLGANANPKVVAEVVAGDDEDMKLCAAAKTGNIYCLTLRGAQPTLYETAKLKPGESAPPEMEDASGDQYDITSSTDTWP